MYYLNNICFLCLTRNNNVIYQNDNYLEMQRKLKYIVPEEMLTKSDIPKYICNYCVERLNSINKFRRKCLKNIAIFNEYIQTLTQNSNSFRNLSINLTDTVRHENMNEIDSNIENTDEKLISSQEIKIETSETDPESVEDDQIEDIFIDTNNINQMVIKTEDLSIKTEIDEEFTSKNEICFYESNSQNNVSGVNTFSQIRTQFDGYIPECNIEEENDFQEKFYEVNNFSHGIFNEQLLSDKCISESTTTNKNHNIFECESHELDFPTAKQLDNQTFWIKRQNKPDLSNKSLNEEVLEILKLQQKKQNVEQAPNQIKDTLEKFETKTEINEELIIKDESSDTNGDIFECETCELAFGTKMQLISHTSWCKRNKRSIETATQIQNDCATNSKSESINIFTRSQKKSYPRENLYECDVCKKTFNGKYYFNQHKLIHTGDKPFSCDVCNKKFTLKCTLKKHKFIHTGGKLFECDVCNKKFNRKSYLKRHLIIHSREKPYECDICEKKFSGRYYFMQHKLFHAGKKLFACDVCKMKFTQKNSLKMHNIIHTGDKPFACDVCNKKFNRKSSLKQHKLTHTGDKPFTCDVCNKKFTLRSNLKKHLIIHSGEKPYECDICEKKFSGKYYFKQHKLIHAGEKLFACDVCKMKFTLKCNLKQHKLTHTGDKPFACDICNKKFNRKSHLKEHEIIHSGEKSYECDICEKKFSGGYYFKQHKLFHAGKKLFPCDVCKMKFTQKCDLNKHKIIHSDEKPYECHVCKKSFSSKSKLFYHKFIH